MKDLRVKALVVMWLSGDSEGAMYDACTEEPEIAWQAILDILEGELTDDQRSLLAAGPLEDLLVRHGSDFINRVEQEATVNTRFNYLLGGVWQHGMPEEIWERIERARKTVW